MLVEYRIDKHSLKICFVQCNLHIFAPSEVKALRFWLTTEIQNIRNQPSAQLTGIKTHWIIQTNTLIFDKNNHKQWVIAHPKAGPKVGFMITNK